MGGRSAVPNVLLRRFAMSKEEKMGKLDNTVALITGGSSGIGLATAKRFVEEGSFVFITGRRQEALDQAVSEIGRRSMAVQGDVRSMSDLDRIFAIIRSKTETLDIVFANAGIGYEQPIVGVTEAEYDEVFETNVKGVVFTVQKAVSLMPDGGAIVLNASIAGSVGGRGNGIYGASKAAVRNLARSWTNDLQERRIRVNAISPGPVLTAGWHMDTEELRVLGDELAPLIPAGRTGESIEIANAVVFLASKDSSYITGAELVVDGGCTVGS